jgi:peroxiredoxin
VLIRNTAPVFGADSSPYQLPGEWQISLSSRNLVSNDHYSGTEEQVQRQALANFVTNRQNLADLSLTRALTSRLSLTLGVPFVSSSWANRDPRSPLPGPRVEVAQNGRGIGDISLTSRYWLFDTAKHLNRNIAAGVGVKIPTGNARAQDRYPDRNGENDQLRYVDQSVQPGDGGWGLVMEAHGFWRVNRLLLFGSGSYLANPRNENGTPSLVVARGGPPPVPSQFDRLVNSVPDQYLARLGGAIPVWNGFSASLAWRVEGLPRYDLIGDSNGFRRPGSSMFIEPGISYSRGPHTLAFNVPIAYYYNRRPDPNTALEGDATFPRHIFLTSYSFRLGKRRATQPSPEPAGSGTAQPAHAAPTGSAASVVEGNAPDACPAQAKYANLNFTLKDLENRNVDLSSYRGKVILLDFWATWCLPCKTEIPWFIDFQNRFAKDGLEVIGVSVDDPRDALVPYARAMNMNYTVLQGRGNDKMLDAYGPITSVPRTVLISRDGKVCTIFEGTKSKEAIERSIKALLSR